MAEAIIIKKPVEFLYTLIPLFILIVVDTLGVGLIFPILGALFIDNNSLLLSSDTSFFGRNTAYILSMAIFSASMFLGSPYLGDLSDHIGRRKILMICLLGTIFGFLLCGLAIELHSIVLLMLGRAVGGFTAGSMAICQAAIADLSSPKNKAINFAFISLADCVGFALGPSFSGLLTQYHFGHLSFYSTPFLIAALLACLNFILLYTSFKETNIPIKAHQFAKQVKPDLFKGWSMFISAFSNKKIFVLSMILLIIEISWAAYFQYISVYLISVFDYKPLQIGYFMTWIGIIFGFTLLVLVRFLNDVHQERLVIMNIVMIALGILLSGFTNETGEWFLVIFISAGNGLLYLYMLALFSNAVDINQQGWIMGVFGSISAAGWIIGALLLGLLAPLGTAVPFIVIAFLMLSALAFLKYSKKIS